jgi:hypothetical protein
MRRFAAPTLALSFIAAGWMASRPIQASPADAPAVDGTWKMVLYAPAEIEFAIINVKAADGKLAGSLVEANQAIGPVRVVEVAAEGSKLDVNFVGEGEPTTFRGLLVEDGKKAKGSIRFRGGIYQARVEKTSANALSKEPPAQPAQAQKLAQAQTTKDLKERVAKILGLIDEDPDGPATAQAYTQALGLAEAAGLSAEEVGKLVGKWGDEAKAYGPDWAAEARSRALKALQGKKAYAELATEMAVAADKALPADASTELRASMANILASSARLAGKDAIAAEAEGRAKGFDAKLDAEYHEKVPPFKPEHYAGRSAVGKGNRVVVMEIFTGAECPPCVAADVAFDALLETFKPTEFIGLQHHLHIPGPDPLTNTDTVARAKFYGKEIGGTPSTFFNGKSAAGGGGGMANSEEKYKEYRELIDPALETEKLADIKLTASRTSDEVKISAQATASGGSNEARPKLRLVLIEESIRYPGGNKLRFHENVVRAFPGGVAGKELVKGEGSVEATVKLADLRKAQAEYLAQYPTSPGARGPFRHQIPPMDLDDLAVVALVQDDADHSIWHAVQVPVKVVNP